MDCIADTLQLCNCDACNAKGVRASIEALRKLRRLWLALERGEDLSADPDYQAMKRGQEAELRHYARFGKPSAPKIAALEALDVQARREDQQQRLRAHIPRLTVP